MWPFSPLSDSQYAMRASVLSIPFSARSRACVTVTTDESTRRSVAASHVNFRRGQELAVPDDLVVQSDLFTEFHVTAEV